jgi:hypothetical protein
MTIEKKFQNFFHPLLFCGAKKAKGWLGMVRRRGEG